MGMFAHSGSAWIRNVFIERAYSLWKQQEHSKEVSLWKPEDSFSYSQCLIFPAYVENRKYFMTCKDSQCCSMIKPFVVQSYKRAIFEVATEYLDQRRCCKTVFGTKIRGQFFPHHQSRANKVEIVHLTHSVILHCSVLMPVPPFGMIWAGTRGVRAVVGAVRWNQYNGGKDQQEASGIPLQI